MLPKYKILIIENVEKNKMDFLEKYYMLVNKISNRKPFNQDDHAKLEMLGYNINGQYVGQKYIAEYFTPIHDSRNSMIYISQSKRYIRKCYKELSTHFLNEVFIYTLLAKYNIVGLAPRILEVGYNTFSKIYFITLEYLPNSYELGRFSSDNLIDFITKANILHTLGIVHNDIKPDNLILANDNVYFIDFEFCKVSYPFSNTKGMKTLNRHTPLYAPPEKLGNDALVAFNLEYRDDIWSIGITIIEAFLGIDIFKDCTVLRQLRAAIREKITEENLRQMIHSQELAEIIIAILLKRISTDEIIKQVTRLIYY